MKKTFSARRVPRKIGTDDDDVSSSTPTDTPQTSDSTVKRPSGKSRKSSSLRQSLGPSAVDDDNGDEDSSVVTLKRSSLSRVAVQRNASKRSSLLASPLPKRETENADERPDYSAAALQELKASTPSTPQQYNSALSTAVEDFSSGTQALDLSSKFGSSLSRYAQSSAIPSAIEIAEKKARRARLAKEAAAEYISLDPDDPYLDEDLDDNVMRDDHGKLVLKPKDKYGMSESRLVHEDEDIMENFDEFTEDGRIALGRKAEAEAARKRKSDMAAQIAEAEAAVELESDESEQERNFAFESAQTRHGTYAQNVKEADPADKKPRTPDIITPLPTLDGAIERLRKQLEDMRSSKMKKLQQMEQLKREKIRLAAEEVRIQKALKETADKFEELRKEKGIGCSIKDDALAIEAPPTSGVGVGEDGSEATDSAKKQSREADVSDDEDSEEDERPAFGGLGSGNARQGLMAGLGLGFQRAQSEGSDDA